MVYGKQELKGRRGLELKGSTLMKHYNSVNKFRITPNKFWTIIYFTRSWYSRDLKVSRNFYIFGNISFNDVMVE